MTATELRYIDSDGHILEHPTGMPDYAPAEYRDRIWHIETDETGVEWLHYNGTVMPGELHGRGRHRRAERRGPRQVVPRRAALHRGAPGGVQRQGPPPGHGPGRHRPRGAVPHDAARAAEPPRRRLRARRRRARTTTGARTTRRRARAGCSAPARCRRCTSPTTSPRVAAEIRRVAELPGMVSVFMRPNPAVDWRPFNDPVYDPIWQAAQDTGLPDRAPPVPRRPTCPARASVSGSRGRAAPTAATPTTCDADDAEQLNSAAARPSALPSVLFTQAIANPVDVMSCIAYLTAGGVCERFPEAKFIFLEANGGWIVPWLERLDHHCKKFQWEVPDLSMLPSEYLRRQCWISFDPDEAMLAFTAQVAARRRRPHHLGVGLPAPRREVPRRHRGARPRRSRASRSSRSRRSPARARSRSTA